MIENFNKNFENVREHNSELLLMILKKASIKNKKVDDEELFVDENWKINSKNIKNKTSINHFNLKKILSEIFPDKRISIQDNNDGSQTIFLS